MDIKLVPDKLLTTSGLSILLHGIILLPDMTSYNMVLFNQYPHVLVEKIDLCVPL